MATVYSIQKTKWNQNVPSEFIKTNEQSGRMRIAYGEFEASSLTAGDVIQMFNIPNGARLVDGYLFNDALGASTTLSVGFAAHTNSSGATVALSAAAYMTATSTVSAGRNDVLPTLDKNGGSVVDANQDGVPFTCTLAGGNATGTIVLVVRYVVD